jgi:hypothetical protein
MKIETFSKDGAEFVRLVGPDGKKIAEMTLFDWAFMIANPSRVSSH